MTMSSTQDSGDDSFDIPLLDKGSLHIDGRRRANRYALDYQHFKDLSPQWRASWGLGYRQDSVTAFQLFNSGAPQTNASWLGFLNAEWRPSTHWTLNFGSLVERDRLAPTQRGAAAGDQPEAAGRTHLQARLLVCVSHPQHF